MAINRRRTFGHSSIDRLKDGIEQSNGNRLRIGKRRLKRTNVGSPLFYSFLTKGNHGSNLMGIAFGQPFRRQRESPRTVSGTQQLQKTPADTKRLRDLDTKH
jgi:hypothetical protein